MIILPIGLVMRIAELLVDIARMESGFRIYEKAVLITKDLSDELSRQLK